MFGDVFVGGLVEWRSTCKRKKKGKYAGFCLGGCDGLFIVVRFRNLFNEDIPTFSGESTGGKGGISPHWFESSPPLV